MIPFLAIVLLLLPAILAHPWYFIEETKDCNAQITGARARHGAPKPDGSAVFTVSDNSTGAIVQKVCPGASYNIQIDLKYPGEALLVSSTGRFRKPWSKQHCQNHAANELPDKPLRHTLDIGCNDTVGDTAEVKVTWSFGDMDYFHQGTLTLALDRSCTAASCARNAAGAKSPLPRAMLGLAAESEHADDL